MMDDEDLHHNGEVNMLFFDMHASDRSVKTITKADFTDLP